MSEQVWRERYRQAIRDLNRATDKEMEEAARKALERAKSRPPESVDAWARRLAEDLVKADELDQQS